MSSLSERLDKLPPKRRQKVEERATSLIGSEMFLQDLGRAQHQRETHDGDDVPGMDRWTANR